MSKKRRTKIEIIRDILEIMNRRGCVNKTKIVYGANLNSEHTSRILEWLIEEGLVITYLLKGHLVYEITERGEEIRREINTLMFLFAGGKK